MESRPPPSMLRDRLRGGPLLLAPSLEEVFAHVEGDAVDPSAGVVRALRRSPEAVVETQRRAIAAGATMLPAPTAATTAIALHASGQAYRAAALTGLAVDLTQEAVLSSGARVGAHVAVLGELVAAGSSTREREEARLHVERLDTHAVEGILVTVQDARAALDIVQMAAGHRLPALLEVPLSRAELVDDPSWASTVIVRCTGGELAGLAAFVERFRPRHPAVVLGVRLVATGDRAAAQADAERVVEATSSLGFQLHGVAGPAALDALAAFSALLSEPSPSALSAATTT